MQRYQAEVMAANARLLLAAKEQQRARYLVGTGFTPQRDLDPRIVAPGGTPL